MKKPAPKKTFSARTTKRSASVRFENKTKPVFKKQDSSNVQSRPYVKRESFKRADTKSFTKTAYQGKASNFNPAYRSDVKAQSALTPKDTSWGKVADWYNKHLETNDDTYHAKVIFPNMLRILGDISGKKVLDMACGQGIFSEKLRDNGGLVTGVDLGKELIKIAEANSLSVKQKGTHKVTYHVSSSDDMFMLKDASFDVVVCILALQNIENLQKTIQEASRILTTNGTFLFVLNHPSFRNPRQTFWGYNEADDVQYRRVDEYMSESHIKIDMTPGSVKDKKFTVSFHRPLQIYMKALSKAGFAVTHLEEWISHKESEKGPKQRAENKSRKEIPMFMCIKGEKLEERK